MSILMHLMGESIGNMTAKELKSLENRLERGIGRIRSKKHELLFAEIEYMQKREADLQSENMFLRAKVEETERAQQQQAAEDEMVPAAAGGTELGALPTFDSRGYYSPVNMLAAAPAQYSDHHPGSRPGGPGPPPDRSPPRVPHQSLLRRRQRPPCDAPCHYLKGNHI